MLTWVEISARALIHNIRVFKKCVHPHTQIMAVVKSNAYGHDMALVARLCEGNQHINAFAVASLDEARALYKQGIKKPILVLSFFETAGVENLSQAELNRIRLPLYSIAEARALYAVLKKQKLKARVHIKIDTGTTRIGFLPHEVPAVIAFLKLSSDCIAPEGIYTHFADAEENPSFTSEQNKQLLRARDMLVQAGFKKLSAHSACTAATLQSPHVQLDMIRLGVGLYGLNPTHAIGSLIKKKTGLSLKPVLVWKTTLIQVKTVPRGTTVGYGRTFKAARATQVGIVPVGYYDGYDRKLSHKGMVRVHGHVRPLIGRVCMNLMMIDLTGIKTKRGDSIILLDARAPTNADTHAHFLNTINYEIVTRINNIIPRIEVL